MSVLPTLAECVADGTHMVRCTADGYCKACFDAGAEAIVARPRPFNLFGDTYCARALRKVADVGAMAQMELMAYLHDVVGGKGQFTFASSG